MFRFLATATLLILASSAQGGTITGEINSLDGTPNTNVQGFNASVTTRNGISVTTRASAVLETRGGRRVTVYTVVFDERLLPANDKFLFVKLRANGLEDVLLQGLDGTQPTFQINVIMPEVKVAAYLPCDCSCRISQPQRLLGRLGWCRR